METGMTVAYELIRSKRRTIAIVIDSEGKCRVRAPLQARLSDIEHFVQAKTGWIEQKQQHYASVQKKRQLILTDGMQLSVLDNSYTLRLAELGQVQVNGTVLLCPQFKPQQALEKWLRQQALAVLQERTAHYAELMGVVYQSVKLSSAAKRWGSCSIKGNLNFSWRLVFYPLAVLDYVVVHELAHRREMNHSAAFWKVVATWMPDYKKYRKWLRDNGNQF